MRNRRSKQTTLFGDSIGIEKKTKPKSAKTIIPKFKDTESEYERKLVLLLEGYYLPSAANMVEQWYVRAKRVKEQRSMIKLVLQSHNFKPTLPAKIRLCRIAPKELDRDDNIQTAFKHIKDGIGDWFGLKNDNDTRLQFEYEQQSGEARYYGVRVTVTCLRLLPSGSH